MSGSFGHELAYPPAALLALTAVPGGYVGTQPIWHSLSTVGHVGVSGPYSMMLLGTASIGPLAHTAV
jgi:hypothetical protein